MSAENEGSITSDHTVAQLFIEFSVENPPPYSRIKDLIDIGKLDPLGTARVLRFYQMPEDSTMTGQIEGTSALRDPTDTMGEDSDDHLGMGEAESWFRERLDAPGSPQRVYGESPSAVLRAGAAPYDECPSTIEPSRPEDLVRLNPEFSRTQAEPPTSPRLSFIRYEDEENYR